MTKRTIDPTKDITFEISEALRCFVTKIKGFHEVRFHIEGLKLSLNVESPTSAVQYSFSRLKLTEDNIIAPHEEDISVSVSTVDWFNLWRSIPPRGSLTLCISKQTKVLTLKHSGGRWGGAIFAKKKPKGDASIIVDTVTAESVFKSKVSDIFSTVTFMQCGVLQWNSQNSTVYVAPMI